MTSKTLVVHVISFISFLVFNCLIDYYCLVLLFRLVHKLAEIYFLFYQIFHRFSSCAIDFFIFSLQLIDAAKSFGSIFNMLFRFVVLYGLIFFMQIVTYYIAEF